LRFLSRQTVFLGRKRILFAPRTLPSTLAPIPVAGCCSCAETGEALSVTPRARVTRNCGGKGGTQGTHKSVCSIPFTALWHDQGEQITLSSASSCNPCVSGCRPLRQPLPPAGQRNSLVSVPDSFRAAHAAAWGAACTAKLHVSKLGVARSRLSRAAACGAAGCAHAARPPARARRAPRAGWSRSWARATGRGW